jgi:hypothetical protein
MLHGVIYKAGGWILSRSYFEASTANVVFEFPRDISIEIYGALVSLGLEFVPSSHLALAELCRCAPYLFDLPARSILAADEASLEEATIDLCALEIVKIELDIQFGAEQMSSAASA